MRHTHRLLRPKAVQLKTLPRKGQGMVEFALILPLMLVFLLGIIEFARMLAIYNGVSNAAREAARWGAVVGKTPDNVPYYYDCAGMRAAAIRTAGLVGLDNNSIDIVYDKPNSSAESKFDQVGTCESSATLDSGEKIENGFRVTITVSATYAPIVPIVPIPSRTFVFTASRTIFTNIEGAPACNDDIDNDGDGGTDYSPLGPLGGGDSDCSSATDTTETPDGSSTNCYALTVELTNPSATGVIASPANSSGCASGQYNYNTTVSLTAVEDGGKKWSSWANTNSNSGPATTVTMNGDKTVFVTFVDATCYRLFADVSSGSGSITTPFTPASNCDSDGNASTIDYIEGTQVSIVAVPGSGQILTNWIVNGASLASNINPLTVTMNTNIAALAVFASEGACIHRLTTHVAPNNSGNVIVTDPGACGGGGKYVGNIELTAVPAPNYVFSQWTGSYTSYSNPLYVSMDSDKDITATFTRCYQVLYFAANGTVSIYPQSTGGCPSLSYAEGSSVTLIATGNQGYSFNNWSGTQTGSNPQLTISNIHADQNITANFAASSDCFRLTVTDNPADASQTLTTVPGPNCPSDPTKYAVNTDVQISAAAGTGYTFANWTIGSTTTTSATTMVRITNSDISAIANFSGVCYSLITSPSTGGSVSVTAPAGSSCTTMGGGPGYTYGAIVTLDAVPDPGFDLTEWGGNLAGNADPATLLIDGDKTVTASFELTCYSLAVEVGSGTGSVTSPNPAGTCEGGEYPAFTAGVTFTASPAGHSEFVSWTDDNGVVLSTDSSVSVTLDGDKVYRANFAECFKLEIEDIRPVGSGTISASPAPNCDNGEKYAAGTVVTLTANANPGFDPNSWTHDVSGTGASVTVTITEEIEVGHDFTRECHTLVLNKTPSDVSANTVTATTAPNCTGGYLYGTTVAIQAAAGSGYAFSSWSDGNVASASSAATTLTIGATEPTTATSRFNASCVTVNSKSSSGEIIRVDFANYTGVSLTLSSLSVSWTSPSGQKLTEAHFAASSVVDSSSTAYLVWSGNSGSVASITSWSNAGNLGLTDLSAKTLKLVFSKAISGLYSITPVFTKGSGTCSVSVTVP